MADGLSTSDTLQVRDTCVCLHAQRAARALARRFDVALRPVGLTNGQFSLLNALNRSEPASMRSVADLLAIDRTTLTAALKPLERRGLVASLADESDGRTRRLRLTASGSSLLAVAFAIWRDTHCEVERLLPNGLERLRNDLDALLAGLARSAAPPHTQRVA